MALYDYQVTGKKPSDMSMMEDGLLEADVELSPNINYIPMAVYFLKGVTSLYEGFYQLTALNIAISEGTFTVTGKMVLIDYKEENTSVINANNANVKSVNGIKVTIKQGDTLYSIANKYCKNSSYYSKIANDNAGVLIARDSRNKNKLGDFIHAGTVIEIKGEYLK